MVEDGFSIFVSDIPASDHSIEFRLRKRGFLLKTLSRTIIFEYTPEKSIQ